MGPEGGSTVDASSSVGSNTSTGGEGSTTAGSSSATSSSDDGGIDYECELLVGDTSCYSPPEPTFCVPTDFDGAGSWNGSFCIEDGNADNGPGAPCNIPEGPLQGQRDCAHGLVCAAASAEAITGTCVRLCNVNIECPRGICSPCTDEPFASDGSYGLCLDEVPCEAGVADCIAIGCTPT